MTSSLRQPRLPVLETWIEELLAVPSEDESHVELVDARDASEPLLSSCLRPHAREGELPETLRPSASSAPPRRPRASDLSELSSLLEGDELDLLRFGKSA